MKKSKQVFISYCGKEDTGLAHRLAGDLQQMGIDVWVAPDSIHPGENWVEAINCALDESTHLLVLLSPIAVESQWVRMEMSAAIALEGQGRIVILPCLLKDCNLPALWSIHQIISFKSRYEDGVKELAAILQVQSEVAKPLVLPVETIAPFTPSASQIMDLKRKTGSGIMDCKRALELSAGDIDRAQRALKEIVEAALRQEAILAQPSKSDVLRRVIKIIAEKLDFVPEQVLPKSQLVQDLGCDNLDLMELFMGLEAEFSLEIPVNESYNSETGILRLQTVDALVNYIDDRIKH